MEVYVVVWILGLGNVRGVECKGICVMKAKGLRIIDLILIKYFLFYIDFVLMFKKKKENVMMNFIVLSIEFF